MKWAGMFMVGFVVLLCGLLAALWKLGVLANIGAGWTAIGVVILIGLGVMLSVGQSGSKESVEINRR